jgi:hypothetical protein
MGEPTQALTLERTETFVPPDFQKRALELFGRHPKRMMVLEAILNPDNAGKTVTGICKENDFSRDAYHNALKDKNFTDLLVDIREALYPIQRSELASTILRDAMMPLREAFRVEYGAHGPEIVPYHSSLVKTREQAASIVGLMLKQPDVSLTKGHHEVIHTFQRLPENILEEFAETGVWKEEWGPRPWVKA